MTWIAISDHETGAFSPQGLCETDAAAVAVAPDDDALLVKGSLIIETGMPITRRPKPLLLYQRAGEWPIHLSMQALPGGGLSLVLEQNGQVWHRTIDHSEAGRMDLLRITFSWDAPRRWGRLAVERTDLDRVHVFQIPSPKPLRMLDARTIMQPGPRRYLAPEAEFLALSNDIEPVGPMPSLVPETPVLTPDGYRRIADLKRGDLIVTDGRKAVPVLHRVTRRLPTLGQLGTLRIRAPYFGLQQDIRVASQQRLVMAGSDVEYMFGHEAVLVPVRHLLGGMAVVPEPSAPFAVYTQLILPRHEPLIAAGAVAESLYIGRLRRKPELLQASLLAGLDRQTLPDHGRSAYPVLKPFDALALADQRAA